MPLRKPSQRLFATLILAPGIALLLVWIGRFSGADEIAKMGTGEFLLWTIGTAFTIAATITLYFDYALSKNKCNNSSS